MKFQSASAIIYTRLKHIGFPGGYFRVCPDGLPESSEKHLLEYAHAAMNYVVELRSKRQMSQVVIARDGYVVLGAAAFLRDLFSDGWEGTDEAGRLIHCFVGYIWKQEEFSADTVFPTAAHFGKLIEDWIRPHWEDSKNCLWATQHTVVPFCYQIPGAASEKASYTPETSIVLEAESERLLQWAMEQAASGNNVSVCTNVTVYSPDSFRSPFDYVSTCSRLSPSAFHHTSTTTAKPTVRPKMEAQENTQYKHDPQQQIVSDPASKTGNNRENARMKPYKWIMGLVLVAVLVLLLSKGILRILLLLTCAAAVGALLFLGREKCSDLPAQIPLEPEKKQLSPAVKPEKKQEQKKTDDPFDL